MGGECDECKLIPEKSLESTTKQRPYNNTDKFKPKRVQVSSPVLVCYSVCSPHQIRFTTCWILTGYAGRIRILVRMLHVLHQRLAAQEQFMADGAGRGVRAADQGGVLLQHAQVQLQFLHTKMTERSN